MMNRTFTIIREEFRRFEAPDWVVWFTVKLIPILPSFTAEMLVTVAAEINCTNYHVIVKGLGSVFPEMTLHRTQEITKVLVEHLKSFATQFNSPGCRQNVSSDAQWLKSNLGPFTTVANYSDLKDLNISGLAALETLSPNQKAELLLDPSSGALENATAATEVLSSILKTPDEKQLEEFFETFVQVSREANITYITNVHVRETMLNLTLSALAPKFPLFQTSDYELWFQINLALLLASFRPSVLVVIPTNLTCDSYDAILKGLEMALADLPSGVKVELASSVEELRQSPPKGCLPPLPVGLCKETLVDEKRLCQAVSSGQLETRPADFSGRLCNFSISEYACSSVASTLSSDELFTLLTCKAAIGTSNGTETWKLFFQKVAGVLEDALSKYSNKSLSGGQPQSHVLDAIGEVKVNNFSAAQLTDASFVAAWFQDRLRPFLSAVSGHLLSCLSTKNFSCDTYQVVVQALSAQASLMLEEQKQDVFANFVHRFLSRRDLTGPACLSKTVSSADWLEKNFGNFSSYATLKDLQTLNGNFSSFESLALLTPTQAAELTLSSGALNNTNQISAVFNRLQEGNAFENVEEFLTTLSAAPEVPDITPAVRDVMMNRTFTIIREEFRRFEAPDWVVWFTVKLIPILPSFTAEMLVTVAAEINCTNYHVIVKGLGSVFPEMTLHRTQEITKVLVEHLKSFATQFNSPGCRQNVSSDAQWLKSNLGPFTTVANYSDLKDLNISGLAALETLSPNQKAELLLDPSSGALENATAATEVLSSILKTPDEKQLEEFFETFVQVSREANITYITNVHVRETMLNLTLSALAPKFPLFQTSDYELWFQINLALLLASFRPSVLVVIPTNLTCDSYDAILKGLEMALADLPSGVKVELASSVEELRQSPPKGCLPPLPVGLCKETLVDEKRLCQAVSSGQLETRPADFSGRLCNFSISEYACSSVASTLSSDELFTLLTCKAAIGTSNGTETWKLFFQKVAGVLEDALSKYSNKSLSGGQPQSHVLDAIGEVKVNNFSAAQLTDASFVAAWFQDRLRPFLSAVSGHLLSCLSTKNFSCDTYQVVVQALSAQASLMLEEQKQDVFANFVHRFLSRRDLTGPACLSKTVSSADWLEKNFGNFSSYATLKDLQTLNGNFSSFESLALLTPTQAAELTLSSGALNNTNQISAVFNRLQEGNAFENVEEFLTTLSAAPEVPDITPAVRDVMMNRTFTIIREEFRRFEAPDWVVWFTVKLIPILPSFTAEMLVTVAAEINCTNYHVIVKGLSTAYSQMIVKRREEVAAGLVHYLKQSVHQINQPACKQDIKNDTDWLVLNLGQFFTYVPYSDLAEFNISREAVYGSLTGKQKVERILTPGLLEDESDVREVFGSVVNSQYENHLDDFFNKFISTSAQRNVSSINTAVSSIILNMTLMDLVTRFDTFTPQTFALWFQTYLHLFLPGISPDSLSVIPKTISCDSYREIVKGCDNVFSSLTAIQTNDVYRFTRDYLSHQQGQGQSCVQSTNSDSDWLLKNFGQFRIFASFTELINLKGDFNGVEAADLLTPAQLAELCSAPSRLRGPQDVYTVMSAVETQQLSDFFDVLSPNIQVNELNYSVEVKQAFLQTVFVRGGLSSPSVSDSEVSVWLRVRLRPLLSALSSANVTVYFDIVRTRGCGVRQEAVSVLDSLRTALNENTQRQIYNNIQQLLTDAEPLRCYGNGSFYLFLKTFFLHFGFPDLSTFLSLIPVDRRPEVLSSISTVELSEFLQAPQTLGDGTGLCDLLSQYNRTTQYLEKEPLGSVALARQVLSCVWPQVLKMELQSEVDQWFDSRLVQYLPLLTSQFIGPAQLSNATCLPYKKLVSVLGNNYNFSKTDFTPEDVYSSMKVYLTNGGSPRCYDASDSQLNSTNWLVSYIGVFISYVTLSDLNSFVSSNQIGVFLENPENLQLLNSTVTIQSSVASYYITQLYIQNPSFNPIRLPGQFLCGIPSFAFELLGTSDSLLLIQRINVFCNGTESPEITAALAANLPSISSSTIHLLGNQSVGLTEGQISSASSDVIKGALSTLSAVDGWNQGQANAVIQTLIESDFPIDSGSSLLSLGTLVKGVPSETISSITPSELLSISNNPTFISNILSAPVILQLVYVMKIVSINETKVIENVPDALAGSIPRVLLVPQESVNVTLINQKQWTQEQAVMLFGSVASVSTDTEELSEALLQGFTCTSIQTLSEVKVKQLVRACRHRPGRKKVQLKESQLMCMYNFVKDEASPSFTDLPSETLLYYSYEKVAKANCRSYFSAVGTADYSVLSSVLDKQTTLFNNARDCLGISGQSLSKAQVEVLGNLSCTLDPVYIQNSDPAIIESLKNCHDLSEAQISAVETLLLTGNTAYGNSSVWDQQTLERLDILPLYFTEGFWQRFNASVKRKYMKVFMPSLRTRNTEKPKLKKLFKNCNAELDAKSRIRRSAVCTAGNITEATITDASFPFGYTLAQFDACLDVRVLRDNLAAVTEKVDDNDFQRVVLNKLKQVYPGGLADSVLKVLASVSRQATVDEIRTWSVTTIDTLTTLMDKNNGEWDRDKSKEVILRYLSVAGHTLGTNELNVIGSSLCSLNISTLQSIKAGDLSNANVLDLSSCSYEQKSVLYVTANSSYRAQRNNGPIYYHLINPYLGGAPLEDVRALASYNIAMDVSTLRSLSLPVVTSLSVSDVRALMGSAVADLKVFENDSVVQAWIASQPQSQLDTLNLGLRGGRADLSTSSAPVTGQTNINGNSTQTPTLSQSATTVAAEGSASALHLGPGVWFISSCVWLLTLT
ncbi:uncharacterized protein LOC127520644 [Ctenopharyngodon idella]|uniref:uncharacterized protein LOC127520644 n=1 Tax=Ctenopharyngodon idella TaxID=7959 RepID=UPI00223153EA|nr:uncharacterized protein LOC127520644 [Ctenopharyngodon idella]